MPFPRQTEWLRQRGALGGEVREARRHGVADRVEEHRVRVGGLAEAVDDHGEVLRAEGRRLRLF